MSGLLCEPGPSTSVDNETLEGARRVTLRGRCCTVLSFADRFDSQTDSRFSAPSIHPPTRPPARGMDDPQALAAFWSGVELPERGDLLR